MTYTGFDAFHTIGNITSYDGNGYSYSGSHKHAVSAANGVTYSYDANGNMTLRDASGTTNDYAQNFNVENELSSVVNNGSTTTFTYDAAGIRVKTIEPGGTTHYYPFPGYEEEVNGATTTRHTTYGLAGQTVALRVRVVGGSNTLYYQHSDHLGSTVLLTNISGGAVAGSTARYYPFGEWRTEPTSGLTDIGYTGHRHNNLGNAPDDIGLIYMNARWYLPGIAHFISADTLVPDPTNPQSFNRYSYVRNSPLNFIDPTGHKEECSAAGESCGGGGEATQVLPQPSSPPTPLGPPMNDYYLSGSNFSTYHEGVDVLSRNLDDKNVLASTVGTVRISDSCGDSCPGCYNAQTYDPCEYTLNETPANWGVGNVLIVEYLYEALPQDVIELLGLNPDQSLFFQYQHLSSISISVGQEVSLAMVIAQVGNTGISDGDHLHLEIKMGASGTFNNISSYDATAINTWQNKRSGIPPLTVVDPNLLWDIP